MTLNSNNPAKKIHEESIIIDGLFHSVLVDPPLDPDKDIIDFLLSGGVTAINLTVVMDIYPADLAESLKSIYSHLELLNVFPEKTLHVLGPDDLSRAKKEGKLGIIFGMQGAGTLGGDLRFLTILNNLGIRIVQLTYNHRNELGSGVYEPIDHGLTRFGQQAVIQMNKLGIVIDLSHVGLKTSLDAIELSEDPVIFSHSSVKKLCEHRRNITDEQIKAVAEKGGMVGICPHAIMCQKGTVRPTINEFIDHIEYVAGMVGIDHVGIGTDRFRISSFAHKIRRVVFERTLPGFYGQFSGSEKHVEGFNTYIEWRNVSKVMLSRGFSEEDIKKVLGENFLRIFKAVWSKSENVTFRKELLR